MPFGSNLQLHSNAPLGSISTPHHSHRLSFLRHSLSSTQTAAKLLFHQQHQTIPTHYSNPFRILRWGHRPVAAIPDRKHALVEFSETDGRRHVGARTGTGPSTMDRIVEKLKKFGYVDEDADGTDKGSAEGIFGAEDDESPNLRGALLFDPSEEVRFPWEKSDGEEGDGGGCAASGRKKKSHSSLAELTLPERELRRLRLLAIRTKSKTRIGGAGVTKGIVDKIHDKWKTEEIVRLKCEGPPALNMKRMHEILERKTGGLVIWRSGSSISLYRGLTYELPRPVKHNENYNSQRNSATNLVDEPMKVSSQSGAWVESGTSPRGNMSTKKTDHTGDPMKLQYEHEIDKLLDSLGPRYTDWPGSAPVPVDADLLPGNVPGYNPPFRLLPYGVSRSLHMKDQTAIRRLGRVLPAHFAIGRIRQLEGVAAAVVKLWEKSSIAKIAFKRGVQITTSERMAEELKKLTGGTLLCRNKEYMVFYRGKDFLSPEMTEALVERERLAKNFQDEEEQVRLRASFSLSLEMGVEESHVAGTLGETLEADARWGKQLDNNAKNSMLRSVEIERHSSLARKLEMNLSTAERKLRKAERSLEKMEAFLKPTEHVSKSEVITDEERFMFRKLGLKMKAFLLMGRRGVFGGTVENMHLHWKYRELVKIIFKAKTFADARSVALSLEAESGGVLVSVEKVSKGYAIIVYRGRDYKRPATLRPNNLLTKRKALARSIELQRQEALCRHISDLQNRVAMLKLELDKMASVKDHGDAELYAELDPLYSSQDEYSEDEEGEMHMDTSGFVLDLPSDEGGSTSYDSSGEDVSYMDEDDLADKYIDESDDELDDDNSYESIMTWTSLDSAKA